jgi:hypothetical protein
MLEMPTLKSPGVSTTELILQAAWSGTRDWCERRGMQHAALKSAAEISHVTRQLRERGWNSELQFVSCHKNRL